MLITFSWFEDQVLCGLLWVEYVSRKSAASAGLTVRFVDGWIIATFIVAVWTIFIGILKMCSGFGCRQYLRPSRLLCT